MTTLFDRVWRILGYPPRASASSPFGAFLDENVPAIEIEKLRVSFNIEKNLSKRPNTCDLTITNAAESTVGFFQQRPFHVQVLAGYADSGPQLLFRGDVRWGQPRIEGPDRHLMLQLGDGDRAFRYARVSRSYRGGTPVMQLLKDVAQTMGAVLPSSLSTATELQEQLASGTVVHGASSDALTKILQPYGLTWSIQNGTLQILRESDVRPGEAWLISQETGMIGSPELGTPPRPTKKGKIKNGGKSTLTVRTLLYPQIVPGGRISVLATHLSGTFKVVRVVHTGDSHGDEWTTTIEALPL